MFSKNFNVLQKLFLSLFICVLVADYAHAAMSDADFVEFCRHGSLQEISDAIKNGENANAKDEIGNTPLMMTSHNHEIATILLKAGADVNARNSNGVTPLFHALAMTIQGEEAEALKILLKAGANVNARNNNGDTVLMAALSLPDEAIKTLLEAGADVNASNEGNTALMRAARYQNPEVITMLMEYGANPIIPDREGKRAIDYAMENERLKNTDALHKLQAASATLTGKDALVGRWKIEPGQDTLGIPEDIELLKDGSGIIDKGSIEWKVENDRFYAMHPLQAQAWSYVATDSTLILIDDDGRRIVYSKQ